MPNQKATDYVLELDWIRAISALLILLYHYTTQYQISIGHLRPWPVLFPWGCGAVNVFFLLTSFLTIFTLKPGLSIWQFALKRAKRLYPSYWISICLTSITMALFMPGFLRNYKTILINLTMLQNFVGIQNVDGVYWTLSYELIFYFYVSILLLQRHSSYTVIRTVSIVWILVSYIYYGMNAIGISNTIMSFIKLTLIPYFAAPFAGGMLLATVAKEKKRSKVAYTGVLASLILSFLVQERSYFIVYCIAVAVMVLIVELRFVHRNASYQRRIIEISKYMKPLSFLSSISYPLYLLHQFIGFSIIKHLEQIGIRCEIVIIIPVIMSVCLAWMVQKTVEALIR